MKFALVQIAITALAFVAIAHAQTKIYRCGNNSYTNDEAVAKVQNCRLMEGGNVTIVEGTKVNGAAAPAKPVSLTPPPTASGSPGQRVDAGEQRARDGEARTILEAELKKAEARRGDLLKEWNNGEPEKLGPETRNHQKYLDRVADLKAALERNEKDIAGLKRELGRVSATR